MNTLQNNKTYNGKFRIGWKSSVIYSNKVCKRNNILKVSGNVLFNDELFPGEHRLDINDVNYIDVLFLDNYEIL